MGDSKPIQVFNKGLEGVILFLRWPLQYINMEKVKKMKTNLIDFIKEKDFLVCVDSDGCAMDTMDVKHIECFGPKIVEVFGLQKIEKPFLNLWNELNLYSMTRGINRFKGLALAFDVAYDRGLDVMPLLTFKAWTEETTELSNRALKKAIDNKDHKELKLALAWSEAVNEAIQELSDVDQPFEGVETGLAALSKEADIAIVSSANAEAVAEEWKRHGLSQHVKLLLGQDAGSKAKCISDLLSYNYPQKQVIMVGDAPGDLDAARKNNIYFYPIIVGREGWSWKRLKEEAFEKLKAGTFDAAYQQQLIDAFHAALQS